MTVDANFLRGSVAALHSILHFISSDETHKPLVKFLFPSLQWRNYYFNPETVRGKISPSVRPGLEQPLNYARNYLAHLLQPCVQRVIYLDADVFKLWSTDLKSKAVGSSEYCNSDFTRYFTSEFWSGKHFSSVFTNRTPCYFNTGVMVIDLHKWRMHRTEKIEKWMEIQRNERIYELGSLPPFLLVFAGNIRAIDRRWNQHGLGGDSVNGSRREMHPGAVSLLHWSGGGKPWLRLDSGQPCPLDILWSHYDLYGRQQ